jgi:hypothetical protein
MSWGPATGGPPMLWAPPGTLSNFILKVEILVNFMQL